MLPYASFLQLDKNSKIPIYIQLSNGLIQKIRSGIIPKGTKLPGSRQMADIIGLHRKTVIAAYDELFAQNYTEIVPSKGTFVSSKLPDIKPVPIASHLTFQNNESAFFMEEDQDLDSDVFISKGQLEFNDGLPDIRLAPWNEIGRIYKSVINNKFKRYQLSYRDVQGETQIRESLGKYLSESRGLRLSKENILITRGSIMGLYLAVSVIISRGDHVIVGDTNYRAIKLMFKKAGANIHDVKVDEEGISVSEIEELCKRKKIRAVFVTPHHHYPTTVTLSAERRIKLLELANAYDLAILEDDYDYDYHYDTHPILPLASADETGRVIYVGSFCKVLAPSLRIGYAVAPANVIREMCKLRRIIDRQGDSSLEMVLHEMLESGLMRRHLKKTQKEYHIRRDHLCKILSSEFENQISFKVPGGGMAIWVKFNPEVSLPNLSRYCAEKNVYLYNGKIFNSGNNFSNATRMGFASLQIPEQDKGLEVLKSYLKK